jgi:predicted amino acid dehydrogenase
LADRPVIRFAFVIHPLSAHDAARRYPLARLLPPAVVEALLRRKEPIRVSRITGIHSAAGASTEGWFIGCPLTSHQIISLPIEEVYGKIAASVRLGVECGAAVVGLGAFTSVVGDGGVSVQRLANAPVTTGNSYTVATAVDGAFRACEMLELDTSQATLAVVGATGSIGRTCAQLMAPSFAKVVLAGRDLDRTRQIASELPNAVGGTGTGALPEADVVVSVTSSDSAVILPEHLKPGCVVCDVARPRDVSARVAKERPDVLVIEGGVVEVPGDVDFGFDFGFPPRMAYACMSETMLLALEGRPESFTLGKEVSVQQVEETRRLAAKHGFRLAGFRSFERPVDEAAIDRARRARRQPAPAR